LFAVISIRISPFVHGKLDLVLRFSVQHVKLLHPIQRPRTHLDSGGLMRRVSIARRRAKVTVRQRPIGHGSSTVLLNLLYQFDGRDSKASAISRLLANT
jgi:hypothetical protein